MSHGDVLFDSFLRELLQVGTENVVMLRAPFFLPVL